MRMRKVHAGSAASKAIELGHRLALSLQPGYRPVMAMTGAKFRIYPTAEQKRRLSAWMGCAKWIYNAKCKEFDYFLTFKRKSASHVGYVILPDQAYAQFRSETSQFLHQCPSQVLRNTCTQWHEAARRFLQKKGGKSRKKRKLSRSSVTLTRELFRWEHSCFTIGTKKHPIGKVSINAHRSFEIPASVVVSQDCGSWYLSFCYENPSLCPSSEEEVLDELAKEDPQELPLKVMGLDRGVKIPVQASDGRKFDFSDAQKKNILHCEKEIVRNQVRLSRQQKKDKDVPRNKATEKNKNANRSPS
jgi:putative transposase